MERMASAFMGRMDVMASAQQRMLEFVMQGGGGSGSGGPRALAAIMNQGPATRRVPTMQFEGVPTTPRPQAGGMLALQLGPFDADSPPAAWAVQSPVQGLAGSSGDADSVPSGGAAMPLQFHGLAGASGDAAIVPSGGAAMPPLQSHGLAEASGDTAIVPGGSAVANNTAMQDLDKTLSMLGERKVDKDAIAAAAKAKAKDDRKGKAELGAEAGSATAKGKGKGEGKCKAKAKASPKAKAGAKAGAAAKASPKAKAGAKAGAKAKAVNKVKAGAKDGAVLLKLGCGKCRGGVGGCALCRNPDFAGLRWSLNDM